MSVGCNTLLLPRAAFADGHVRWATISGGGAAVVRYRTRRRVIQALAPPVIPRDGGVVAYRQRDCDNLPRLVSQRNPAAVRADVISPGMRPMIAPAEVSPIPSHFQAERRSPRKSTPNNAIRTTLSLSIGATRAASPSLSARK